MVTRGDKMVTAMVIRGDKRVANTSKRRISRKLIQSSVKRRSRIRKEYFKGKFLDTNLFLRKWQSFKPVSLQRSTTSIVGWVKENN